MSSGDMLRTFASPLVPSAAVSSAHSAFATPSTSPYDVTFNSTSAVLSHYANLHSSLVSLQRAAANKSSAPPPSPTAIAVSDFIERAAKNFTTFAVDLIRTDEHVCATMTETTRSSLSSSLEYARAAAQYELRGLKEIRRILNESRQEDDRQRATELIDKSALALADIDAAIIKLHSTTELSPIPNTASPAAATLSTQSSNESSRRLDFSPAAALGADNDTLFHTPATAAANVQPPNAPVKSVRRDIVERILAGYNTPHHIQRMQTADFDIADKSVTPATPIKPFVTANALTDTPTAVGRLNFSPATPTPTTLPTPEHNDLDSTTGDLSRSDCDETVMVDTADVMQTSDSSFDDEQHDSHDTFKQARQHTRIDEPLTVVSGAQQLYSSRR